MKNGTRFRKWDVVGHEDECGCALLVTGDHEGVLISRCRRAKAQFSQIGDVFPTYRHVLLYRRPSKKGGRRD